MQIGIISKIWLWCSKYNIVALNSTKTSHWNRWYELVILHKLSKMWICSLPVLSFICSLLQVNQAVSFLDHLLYIQQEQRYITYSVFRLLGHLRRKLYLLNCIGVDACCSNEEDQHLFNQNLYSSGSKGVGEGYAVSPNQYVVLKCMWQQKVSWRNLYK